jgi:hypothetical protein
MIQHPQSHAIIHLFPVPDLINRPKTTRTPTEARIPCTPVIAR